MRVFLLNVLVMGLLAIVARAQNADSPPPAPGGPGGGPGGDRFIGGPPGMGEEIKLAKQFDKDGDKKLSAAERKEALAHLAKERESGRGRRGPGGFGRGPGGFGGRGNQEPPKPGMKLSPGDVKSFAGEPFYDPNTLRTIFLEFENDDWEKEMAQFKGTDVEMPAKATIDGKTYHDIGVHFHGASSFMGVGEGRKRSLALSMDFINKDQNVGGYRTIHLLNANGDPTFLRGVLYDQIAREFIPNAKSNFVRVVINGESWGIYVNRQHFNKDFLKDYFGTTKGARWKVHGSPNGRGTLAYLGADPAPYKRIYQIKSKDEPAAWETLIKLCKTISETPADKLEEALAPILDVDGALKFLALENVLINNDGYWIRTSDYNLYLDERGKFHIIPHDTNETFSRPGGPGGGGGFGPGMMVAGQMMRQGDKNDDKKLSQDEISTLASAWFDKLDDRKKGKVTEEEFAARIGEVFQMPQGFGPGGGGPGGGGPRQGGGRGFMPGAGLFPALDADKDRSLSRQEISDTFGRWFEQWDKQKSGALTEEAVRVGLDAILPRPNFGGGFGGRGGGPGGGGPGGPGAGGPGGGPAGPGGGIAGGPGGPGGGFGGRGGPGGGGFGGGVRVNGVELDPLAQANDQNKPLISKLLAVPFLRAKYLGYVRQIAEQWLDWEKFGPIAKQYQNLIAEDVKLDTRKVQSSDGFLRGVDGETTPDRAPEGAGPPGRGGGTITIKQFADQRRAYLLNHADVKKAVVPAEAKQGERSNKTVGG
jgi:spore coat protein CotH